MLQTAVIIDYQNLHLVARNQFNQGQNAHQCLVHPLFYAEQLIKVRNEKQAPGQSLAELSRVLVYRGLPSSEYDPRQNASNQAQKAEWELDPRVTVTLGPLTYRKLIDAKGREIWKGIKKGVDVLCALALVREARDPAIGIVILCSQDTDLEPALDEALRTNDAKIETASWYNPAIRRHTRQIRPTRQRIWNTALDANTFNAARDLKVYP